jgi:ABC-type uncharacterized transport system ATPase subunit
VKLELRGITKRFGSFTANESVDLTVGPGEVHALLGENGAGKTTLMNVLFGLYRHDEGQILIDGQPTHFASPRQALEAKVGMVHQHFMLVPVFTVAENVVLGDEPTHRLGLLDRRRASKQIRDLSSRFGLQVDPDALAGNLPVGVQQRVEIVKSLVRDAQLLILDEPTAVLTPQETKELFRVMSALRASGRSMLFITHKLGEVLEIADRITVLRRGKVVGTTTPAETNEAELAAMMVGRSVSFAVPRAPAQPGEVVLSVQGLSVADELGATAVDDISFEVRRGEILAVAGVQGNGQTELARALFGLAQPTAGTIAVAGREVTTVDPHDHVAAGVGYVPEDRHREGLVLGFSVAENLVLDLWDRPPFAKGIAFNLGAVDANAAARVDEFDVRCGSSAAAAATLSGGNQQKVVLARELSRPLDVLIASQPTRGLDVGSIETVHRRIVEERDKGTAVVLVSTELDEILALGDRIAVMYRGKISGYADSSTSPEDIGLLMAGAQPGAKGPSVNGPSPANGPGPRSSEGVGHE